MYFGMMLPFLVGIAIIFVLAILISFKNEKGDEGMFKQLYIYLVLFATLMMTIGGGIGIFNGMADYVSPNPYTQTFTEYKMMKESEYPIGEEGKKPPLNGEELKKDYEEYVKLETERTKQQAVNMVIKSFGFIIIPFPIFLYFNRLRKQQKGAF